MRVRAADPDPPQVRLRTLQRQRAEVRKRQIETLEEEEVTLVGKIDRHRTQLGLAQARLVEVRKHQDQLRQEAEAERDAAVLEVAP